jgi:hypothetical protein
LRISYVVVPTVQAQGRTVYHEPARGSSPRVGHGVGSAVSIERRLRDLEDEHRRLGEAIPSVWEPSALKRRKLHVKDALYRLRALAESRALAPAARVLGSGAEGRIILGRTLPSGETVAMKCEPAREREDSHAWREYVITKKMGGARGFARTHAFLEGEDVLGTPSNVCVLDLLGPSLDDLYWATREISGASGLSAPTVLALLHDALSRVLHCNARGYAHRDVKPGNLLMGRIGARRSVVHLVDFGASERLDTAVAARDDALEGERLCRVPDGEAVGTARYAPSCDAAVGLRADIESLLYSMAALAHSALPWDGCLDESGAVRAGRADEFSRAKAAAAAGDETAWAGPDGLATRPVLLELMARLRAADEAPELVPLKSRDEAERIRAGLLVARARAHVRDAHRSLTGLAKIGGTVFDWVALGVSWPEADDAVADAVLASSSASGIAAGSQVTVVGGVCLLKFLEPRAAADAS